MLSRDSFFYSGASFRGHNPYLKNDCAEYSTDNHLDRDRGRRKVVLISASEIPGTGFSVLQALHLPGDRGFHLITYKLSPVTEFPPGYWVAGQGTAWAAQLTGGQEAKFYEF